MEGRDDHSGDDSLLKAIASAPEARPPEGASLVGRTVGRFHVLRKIGSGGMGVVYEARDERLDRRVALKVLARSDEAEARARFVREGKSASQVTHANVAVIYEAGEDGDVAFIAMELVEGETLDAWLHTARSLAERLRVARDVASALGRAHALGIVHRDLKPGNVMIARDGTVKVLDFGLAKRRENRGGLEIDTTETGDARLLGTPSYMSPEQVKGKPVSARSDVFSFGALAYELFTGRRPFRGDTITELFIAIDRDEPPPMRSIDATLPAALVAVVEKCLRKKPEDRFEDANAVASALEQVSSGAAHRAARGPWVRAAALVAVVAAAGGAAIVASSRDRQTSAPAAAVSASSPASPVATAITDLPPPRTNSQEAATAYAIAMQGLRDASIYVGLRGLSRAVKLDPDFAAAQLQLAVRFSNFGHSLDDRRRHFTAASANRGSLSERDRDLLAVAEPLLIADVPDYAEAVRRAQAAARRWPQDADVAVIDGDYLCLAARYAEGYAEYDRALALDPHFALALHQKASSQNSARDLDGAIQSATRCLEVSPEAASCTRRRADAFIWRGQCEEVAAEARRAIAVDPKGAAGYLYLAEALFALHAPRASVVDALHRRLDLIEEPKERQLAELWGDAYLAIGDGDFTTAQARAAQAQSAVADSPSESDQLTHALITAYEETGQPAKAVEAAEDFLKRLPAWTADAPGAARPQVLAVLRRAGRMSEAEFQAKRERWIEEERGKYPPQHASAAWFDFYARPARTAAEAREALDALPRFLPLRLEDDGLDGETFRNERLGNLYLLAGRPQEAIPYLRGALAACEILDAEYWTMLASEELGEALAATGDTKGACEPLQRVLVRWGRARPRSVTADRARELSRKLGCASP
jgi:serine/threonine-protein kinase